MSGRHVLVCPYTKFTWGHLVRCLAVADALTALGDRVTFVCGPEARGPVTTAGYELVEHVSAEHLHRLLPAPRGNARTLAWCRRSLASARELVRRLAADVVLTDLQPILNVAAALECIPSASLLNLELMQAPLASWLAEIDACFAELALPRWAAARVFGDCLIVCDTPDVTGLRDLAPPLAGRISHSVREVRFVGPVLRSDDLRWSPIRPAGARSRVIVSFGERGGEAILDVVLEGCAQIDADFVVVTSGPPTAATVQLASSSAGRARVTLVDFLPDFAQQLCTADALITHGGHGTLVQALAIGVPILVVPTTPEREINAHRLRGIGEIAPPNRNLIRASIGAQLELLLHDRTRDVRRHELATSLCARGGARSAATVVDQLARLSLPEAGTLAHRHAGSSKSRSRRTRSLPSKR